MGSGRKGEAMFSGIDFWPACAGAITLMIGAVSLARQWRVEGNSFALSDLGRVFVAAPLALFGAEHLVIPRAIMQGVPVWMPERLFWAYFVGMALIAAGLSLAVGRCVRPTVTLLTVLFFLFVVTIHLPNLATHVKSRFPWAVALRDISFGAGTLAATAFLMRDVRPRIASPLLLAARLGIAIAVIFFGVENLLHLHFAPGVPLDLQTPAWVPVPALWALITGAILLVAGVGMLLDQHARRAATAVGMLMTALTVCLYFPFALMARGAGPILNGENFVADTLLYGGVVLLLAEAMPSRERQEAETRPAVKRSAARTA
jgi:uncharacterized membrane protein YphA (DoxX/SURF4 family)